MIFKSQLTFNEQPAPDINQAQSNTLKTFSLGGGMVYLNVTGSVMGGENGQDGGIATIMTAEECLALVKMLKAACLAAENEPPVNPATGVAYEAA